MRLAKAYHVLPRELAERMTAEELTEEAAFAELEPWGEHRMDLRFGLLGSIILNIVRGKNDPPVKPADLVPDFDGERRAKGVDLAALDRSEVRAMAAGLAEAMGGGGGQGKAPGPTIAG